MDSTGYGQEIKKRRKRSKGRKGKNYRLKRAGKGLSRFSSPEG